MNEAEATHADEALKKVDQRAVVEVGAEAEVQDIMTMMIEDIGKKNQ